MTDRVETTIAELTPDADTDTDVDIEADDDPAFSTPSETLPVDWVPREQLLPNDWNPNSMTTDKREELAYSILDNGWTQPIVVKAGTDRIIDGEQRWHASGLPIVCEDATITPSDVPAGHVPIFEVAVDDDHARVATMQHNAATGTHNATKLGSLLADLAERGTLAEASDRLNIGSVGLRRLLDRATEPESGVSSPDELFDIPDGWSAVADPDDARSERMPFTERLDFLIRAEEATRAQLVFTPDERADLFVDLCEWAVNENVHSQTRVDMRTLAGRDPVYEPYEPTVTYTGIDVAAELDSYLRADEAEPDTEDTDD